MINAKTAWNTTHGNTNVIIGVTDGEFSENHPDLQGQVVNIRSNSVPAPGSYHGTSALGTVAATTDNGIGISGIGFNCKLDFSDQWANDNVFLQMSKDGVKVLNGSWHYGYTTTYNPWSHLSNRILYNEIYENGTIACFGAGNGRPVDGGVDAYVYPASLDHNISVSSVAHSYPIGTYTSWPGAPATVPYGWRDVHEVLSPLSDYNNDMINYPQWFGYHTHNHNDRVDICAPGYGLNVLLNSNNANGLYAGNGDGTSFSSPRVAGTLGLMLSANPWLSPYQMEYILKQTAADLYSIPQNAAYIGKLGSGRLDAGAAVALAANYDCNTQGTQTFYVKGVEINTICQPGFSSNGVLPQLNTVLENGTPPYTYQWEAMAGNNVTLSANNIANPTVTTSTGNHLLYYYLTVRDNSYIQKVASQLIKIQLKNTPIYDIAGRDSYVDMLNEPNTQTSVDPLEWNVWKSPDIWNRFYQDGGTEHQNPEYFAINPNYVYMRVTNVGCADSPPNMKVKLYWSKASTGEDWADDWTITTYTNPQTGQTWPAGGEITTVPLDVPILQPGQSVLLSHSWHPIAPSNYDNNITSVDVCVLGRIEEFSIPPFGMTFIENTLLKYNVVQNNNIITRNLLVNDLYGGNKTEGLPPGIKTHLVFIANAHNFSQLFDIEMKPEKNVHLHFAGDFSSIGKITLYLGDLFDIWRNNGGEGNYESMNIAQKSVTFNGNTTLKLANVPLKSKGKYAVKVEFKTLTGTEYSPITHNFHLSQYLVESGRRSLYGNVDFEIRTRRHFPQEKDGNMEVEPEYFKVYPNPSKNVLYLENLNEKSQKFTAEIHDIAGKIVFKTENLIEIRQNGVLPFDISTLASGVYYIHLTNIQNHKDTHKFVKE